MILYYMEIIIAIGEGETLQQALRQLKMDVAGPFTLTIKTEKKKTTTTRATRAMRATTTTTTNAEKTTEIRV